MKRSDNLFKIGLGLQVLLIPVALLWHFSPEANYYNWVVSIALLLIAMLCFWPQLLTTRARRLRAIKIQAVFIVLALVLSLAAYAYFYHFTRANCTPSYAIVHGAGTSGQVLPSDLGQGCNFDSSQTERSLSLVMWTVRWHTVFGRDWVMLLEPGIAPLTAGIVSVMSLSLPAINFYRYQLDKKRIRGIKKEELFQ